MEEFEEWDEVSQPFDTKDAAEDKLQAYKDFWKGASKYEIVGKGRTEPVFADGRMQYRAVLHIKSKEADIGSATYGRRY